MFVIRSNTWRTNLRGTLALALACMMATPLMAAAPDVIQGAEYVSPPSVPTFKTVDMLRLPPAPKWKPGDPIDSGSRLHAGNPDAPVPVPRNPVWGHDSLVQKQWDFVPARDNRALGTTIINQNVLTSTRWPNDPTGDIGTLQFVAAINGQSGQYAVYDKVSGAQVVAPTLMASLGSGGACANGLGDPIVIFDELANRWVFTEVAGNNLCVYISNIDDLDGPAQVTWTRYVFDMPTFPQSPKYGMWPSAYLVGANESGTAGRRPFYALDRLLMLAGAPATFQRLTIPNLAGFGFQMTQPADLAGTSAPLSTAPGLFMRHRDDEAHNPGTNNPMQDFLELFEFKIDFVTPANSAITGPITFPISEFSSDLNGLAAREAFHQPSGTRLDPMRETIMHRLTYRRLANYEVLVGNFVTDLFLGAGSAFPNDTGAIRWFEMRRTIDSNIIFRGDFEDVVSGAEAPWVLHQEGTFAPADTAGTPAEQGDRWMAGSAVDASGNIGLAYSHVRQTPAISAGLRYTGRLAGDPLGVMTAGENLIVAGGDSVTDFYWGDHSDMGIDPVDGCTFWFVGNYSAAGVRTNRAAAFKFDECGGPSFTLTSPAPSVSVCANSAGQSNAPPITINGAAFNGFSGAVTLTYPNPFPTGTVGTFTPPVMVSLPGSSTAQLTANNTATPGTSTIVARGTSGAVVRNLQLSLNVATGNPGQPTLTAPADNASGIGATPTFTWSASAQAVSYLVEASSSASFTTTFFSQTVTGTSLLSPVALPTNQQIFWRVRASNVCGNATSPVFSYNPPTFTMGTTTPSVTVCAMNAAPSNAPPITLALAAVNGFTGTVAMSYPNPFPAGISGSLTPANPSVPGSSIAQLAATNVATPGAASVVARAVAGPTTRDVPLTLDVVTMSAAAPTLTAPADGAMNVTTAPTFTWSASPQATSYIIEASTTNTFSIIFFRQTVTGTSLVSPVVLPTCRQVFWRVRAYNICGNTLSAVFSFTTACVPGDCPAGPAPTIVTSQGFESGAPGWVQEGGGVGTNTWAITTLFPFAGTRALQGLTPATASDQRFISPSFTLPTVGQGLFLSFQSRQQMELSGPTGCWDGGFIEISVNGLAYTQIPAARLLTDPYNGPLGRENPATPTPAWCGDPQAYLKSVINLAPYAGSNVRFRFRVTSDNSNGRAEGWNIDNVEIKRCN